MSFFRSVAVNLLGREKRWFPRVLNHVLGKRNYALDKKIHSFGSLQNYSLWFDLQDHSFNYDNKLKIWTEKETWIFLLKFSLCLIECKIVFCIFVVKVLIQVMSIYGKVPILSAEWWWMKLRKESRIIKIGQFSKCCSWRV